jgi:hypothetical protein
MTCGTVEFWGKIETGVYLDPEVLWRLKMDVYHALALNNTADQNRGLLDWLDDGICMGGRCSERSFVDKVGSRRAVKWNSMLLQSARLHQMDHTGQYVSRKHLFRSVILSWDSIGWCLKNHWGSLKEADPEERRTIGLSVNHALSVRNTEASIRLADP